MVVRAWAGEYNRRVTVYRNASGRTANTDGQRPESAEQYCQRWCSIKPIRAVERYMAEQTHGDVTHEVRMRRDTTTTSITAGYWLTLSDGTRFDVRGVYEVDDARQELRLECNERE